MEQMKLIKFSTDKGGEHAVRLVASKAKKLLIVVDETKLVQNLNMFSPTSRSPSHCMEASRDVIGKNGKSNLRMANKKAGPVVTDQETLF